MNNTFSIESILFKDMYSNNKSISNTKVTKSLDDCVYDAYKSSEDLKFYETYTMINDYNNTQKLRMLNKLRYATNNIKNKQAHNSCESYIRSIEEDTNTTENVEKKKNIFIRILQGIAKVLLFIPKLIFNLIVKFIEFIKRKIRNRKIKPQNNQNNQTTSYKTFNYKPLETKTLDFDKIEIKRFDFKKIGDSESKSLQEQIFDAYNEVYNTSFFPTNDRLANAISGISFIDFSTVNRIDNNNTAINDIIIKPFNEKIIKYNELVNETKKLLNKDYTMTEKDYKLYTPDTLISKFDAFFADDTKLPKYTDHLYLKNGLLSLLSLLGISKNTKCFGTIDELYSEMIHLVGGDDGGYDKFMKYVNDNVSNIDKFADKIKQNVSNIVKSLEKVNSELNSIINSLINIIKQCPDDRISNDLNVTSKNLFDNIEQIKKRMKGDVDNEQQMTKFLSDILVKEITFLNKLEVVCFPSTEE